MVAYDVEDTIAAIASAAGGAARGIVRLSGPDVQRCVAPYWLGDDPPGLPSGDRARCLVGNWLLEPPARRIPCQLYCWRGPRSYTQQNLIEIHTLGSPPLLERILRQICAVGARLARPGEFTLRAFLAGRLDLPQAEAVLGVIDAVDQRQLKTALTQLAGGLSGPLGALRDQLLNLLADVEAGLDFVDEDIEFVTNQQIRSAMTRATEQLERVREQIRRRGARGDQPRVLLCGRPNVGKSTLWNALVGESQALVSDVPGTTRDYLEGAFELIPGVVATLIDTAGVDTTLVSAVDQHSQVLSGRMMDQVDCSVLCLAADRPADDWELQQLQAVLADEGLVALTKTDLGSKRFWDSVPGDLRIEPTPTDTGATYTLTSGAGGRCWLVPTSAADDVGMAEFTAQLATRLTERIHPDLALVASTATRCLSCLERAAESSGRALGLAASEGGQELIAAEIRETLAALGEVMGTVYTDDILDRVFSRFCIGK